MRQKIQVLLILSLGFFLGRAGSIVFQSTQGQANDQQHIAVDVNKILSDVKKDSIGGELDKFSTILGILEEQYYTTGIIDSGAMLSKALKGYVDALDDPYTIYLDSEENSGFKKDLKGEQDFEGIGAVVAKKEDSILIQELIKDSPAFKAGLQPLDVILEIDGSSTSSMSLSQAVEKIRGKKGTQVELTVLREDRSEKKEKKVFKQKVTRDTIQVPSVTAKVYTGSNTKKLGYIAISIIGEETERLLRQSVEELTSQQVQGIILDLRGNGGGYLPIAVEVASHFIPENEIIVSTKYKSYPTETLRSKGYGQFEKLPVVVLMDGLTASAGEIIAGALREDRGAILIGEKTFGKGSIQTIQELPEGASLKFTIGKRYTPLGENIDKKGILPDIDISFDTTGYQKNQSDNQLEKAKLELSKLIK